MQGGTGRNRAEQGRTGHETRTSAIEGTWEDVTPKVSLVAQLPAAVRQSPMRNRGEQQARSGWNLIMAESLEFIEAAPAMDTAIAAREALRSICL